MHTPSAFVRLENVQLAYATNGRGPRVLDGFSLEVMDNEVVGVYGPNGSGKSSLLNVLAGVQRPDDGAVSFSCVSRPATAYLAQDFAATLLPWFRARTNLLLPMRYAGVSRANAERMVDELVEHFAPDLEVGKYPHELSGGQQQMLAIIRCFSRKPRLALLDEPWSAVNFQYMFSMRQKLAQWAKAHRIASVIVSHNLDDLMITCDRVVTVVGPPLRVVCEERVTLPHPRKEFDLVGAELMGAKARIYASLDAG